MGGVRWLRRISDGTGRGGYVHGTPLARRFKRNRTEEAKARDRKAECGQLVESVVLINGLYRASMQVTTHVFGTRSNYYTCHGRIDH